nr:immunoglobulin light chain junction region [Macaca mulatta]MOW09492.1 immunoglobulin light chain junction region [Macaca mulatta]MOW09850.1 immunoglobulin light chain junction region [Macaca mulatta]MOW10964.1 immunoglobulin light chain junction region [Macaca mulatta]MOW12093.1 immunoglobulin light chain junction region [Macaca mulatta]
CQQGNSWPWTF